MKYQNKKNGKIGEVVQESEKFKTVLLVFEDGTDTTISTSTLKRWWKKLPEQEAVEVIPDQVVESQEVETEDDKYVQEVMDQKKELGIKVPKIQPEQVEIVSNEDRCSDGTPYKEVMKDIVEGAKKKAAAAKHLGDRKKKETPEEVLSMAKFLKEESKRHGVECVIREKQPNVLNFRPEGGGVGLYYALMNKKTVWFFAKSKTLTDEWKSRGCEVNHLFDRKFDLLKLDDPEGSVRELISIIYK